MDSVLSSPEPTAVTVGDEVQHLALRLAMPTSALLSALRRYADEPAQAASRSQRLGRTSLTEAEERALRAVGSLDTELPPLEQRASWQTAVALEQVLADAYTVKEVAALLHVSQSRVRQRITARELVAVDTEDGVRVPRFQFEGDRLLRGLRSVLAAMPADVHPLSIARFLDRPVPELSVDGVDVSPRQWLLGGGSEAAAAEVAGFLQRIA